MELINLTENIISINKEKQKEPINYQKTLDEHGANKLIEILENMIKNRYFDQKVDQLINEGASIAQHSTTGHEGSQTVASTLLDENDYLQPNHRGWGWAIGKGLEIKKILAELLGKEVGYCKGKSAAHLADSGNNLMLRSGIQGSYASLAAGVGLSLKMQKKTGLCLCLFGDGASNAGYVHEGMNIASVNNLPVIYLCENNQYSLFTPYKETTSVSDIADRAIGYDIPGYIVNGMDAMAVIQVISKAIKRARSGKGPTFIESKTYRFEGHTSFDTYHYGVYRTKEEVNEWKKKDPIEIYSSRLIEMDVIDEKMLSDMKKEINEQIEVAEEFAKSSSYPEADDYLKGVYSNPGGESK